MSFRRNLTAGALAFGVLAGGAVAGAAPAAAGTSIGSTYNGASHIYYKFYASTNTFCIKKYTGTGYTAYADFGPGFAMATSKYNDWYCVKLTSHGMREGQKVKFTLFMNNNSTHKQVYRQSSGYVTI